MRIRKSRNMSMRMSRVMSTSRSMSMRMRMSMIMRMSSSIFSCTLTSANIVFATMSALLFAGWVVFIATCVCVQYHSNRQFIKSRWCVDKYIYIYIYIYIRISIHSIGSSDAASHQRAFCYKRAWIQRCEYLVARFYICFCFSSRG